MLFELVGPALIPTRFFFGDRGILENVLFDNLICRSEKGPSVMLAEASFFFGGIDGPGSRCLIEAVIVAVALYYFWTLCADDRNWSLPSCAFCIIRPKADLVSYLSVETFSSLFSFKAVLFCWYYWGEPCQPCALTVTIPDPVLRICQPLLLLHVAMSRERLPYLWTNRDGCSGATWGACFMFFFFETACCLFRSRRRPCPRNHFSHDDIISLPSPFL